MNQSPEQDENPRQRTRLRRMLSPTREERRSMLLLEVRLFVAASWVFLLFANTWPQQYRSDSSAVVAVVLVAFLIRVMEFHIGLVLVLALLFALHKRRWVLAAVAIPLVALTMAPPIWSFIHPPTPPRATGPTFRVMTENLLLTNHDSKDVLRQIHAQEPDIVLLQEYTAAWDIALNTRLKADYPFVEIAPRPDNFGTAIYSKSPFVGSPRNLTLGDGLNPQTRVVINQHGHEIAVYDVHLDPPIGIDFTRNARHEFADLLSTLKKDSDPVIVAGDFNMTDTTQQHADLKAAGFSDAWDLAGRGRGDTWPDYLPLTKLLGIRLDHLYLSRKLTVKSVRIGDAAGSDHRPVIANVALRAK